MQDALIQYGYLLVFIGTILEGDATLIAAAFLAHRGYFRLELVMLVAAVSTSLANQAYYVISRRYGETLVNLSSNVLFETARRKVERHGGFLLVASRFLFGLRIAIPAACGATGMPALRFALLNLAGAALWAVPLGFVGYSGAGLAELVIRDIRKHERLIAAALAIGVAAYAIWKSRGQDLEETGTAVVNPRHLPEEALDALAKTEKARGVAGYVLKQTED